MEKCSFKNFVLKAFGKYAVATFLSLIMVFFLTVGIAHFAVQVIIQIVTLILTCGIIYQVCWDQGNRDVNFIKRGLIQNDKLRGLKIGFIIIIPNIIIWLFLLVCRFIINYDFLVVYKFINSPILILLHWIFPVPTDAVSYLNSVSITALILSVLLFLYVPITCHLGYRLGIKQFSIRESIIYKKTKGKN